MAGTVKGQSKHLKAREPRQVPNGERFVVIIGKFCAFSLDDIRRNPGEQAKNGKPPKPKDNSLAIGKLSFGKTTKNRNPKGPGETG